MPSRRVLAQFPLPSTENSASHPLAGRRRGEGTTRWRESRLSRHIRAWVARAGRSEAMEPAIRDELHSQAYDRYEPVALVSFGSVQLIDRPGLIPRFAYAGVHAAQRGARWTLVGLVAYDGEYPWRTVDALWLDEGVSAADDVQRLVRATHEAFAAVLEKERTPVPVSALDVMPKRALARLRLPQL